MEGMMKLLPLLPFVSKYASLIQTLDNMAPELQEAVNEITAVLTKHRTVLQKAVALAPQVEAAITDVLPTIHQMYPTQ